MTIMATKSRVTIEHDESSDDEDAEIQMKSENEDKSGTDLESNENGDATCDDNQGMNAGWADSIAKILKTNKPKGKKTLVLSRAKKLTDVHKSTSKDAGFEVLKGDGEVKREKIEQPESTQDPSDQPPRKKKKDVPSIRVKPNILERDRERTLSKIATKGVVQLFNAVKKQQKEIDVKLKQAGPLEVKRDKVMKNIDKREFLNVLMGDKSHAAAQQPRKAEKHAEKEASKSKSSNTATWSVLRDDFMMGAKMKDWDKEMEEESEIEKEID